MDIAAIKKKYSEDVEKFSTDPPLMEAYFTARAYASESDTGQKDALGASLA